MSRATARAGSSARDLARGVHEHREDIARSAAANRREPVHSCKFGPQNRVANERGRLVAPATTACSSRPARLRFRAARTSRLPRPALSAVSSAARSSARAAAMCAARSSARAAASSSARTTSTSCPTAADARCQARRSPFSSIAGKRGGEGAVRIAALARCSGAVDRRADERMPELQPSAVGRERAAPPPPPRAPRWADAEGLRCARHHADVLRVVGSGDEEEATGLLRQPPEHAREKPSRAARSSAAPRAEAPRLPAAPPSTRTATRPEPVRSPVFEPRGGRAPQGRPGRSPGEQDAGRVRVKPRKRQRRESSASNARTSPSRAAKISAMPSASRRRATNRSASADARPANARHRRGTARAVFRQLRKERETGREDEEALVRLRLLETESGANRRRLRLRNRSTWRAPAAEADGDPRTGAPTPTPHPSRKDMHVAGPFACVSSSADLPIPASPRKTSAPLERGTRRIEQRTDMSPLRIASVEHAGNRMLVLRSRGKQQ